MRCALIDPGCLERPLDETVARLERFVRRAGVLSGEEARRVRRDLPRAYALATLLLRGVLVPTEDGGVVCRQGAYRD